MTHGRVCIPILGNCPEKSVLGRTTRGGGQKRRKKDEVEEYEFRKQLRKMSSYVEKKQL